MGDFAVHREPVRRIKDGIALSAGVVGLIQLAVLLIAAPGFFGQDQTVLIWAVLLGAASASSLLASATTAILWRSVLLAVAVISSALVGAFVLAPLIVTVLAAVALTRATFTFSWPTRHVELAALTMGIAAIAVAWLPGAGWLAWLLGPAAVTAGWRSRALRSRWSTGLISLGVLATVQPLLLAAVAYGSG